MEPELESQRFAVQNTLEGIEDFFYERHLTDGLPIVPPTEDRVREMLKYTDRAPDEVVGVLPPSWREATAEKIAINAVMAGCRPRQFPVVIGAVEAVSIPDYNLLHNETSTGAHAPMVIINGPVRKELGLNCAGNVLGPGNRVNATTGRALRLVIANVGGSLPGVTCMTTHGQPGKYTMCIGENEEENPWESLNVERGFSADVSTVTVVSTRGNYDIICFSNKVGRILSIIAGSMSPLGGGNVYYGGEPVLLMCPEWAKTIEAAGFSKAQVKSFLFENSKTRLGNIPESEAAMAKSYRAAEFKEFTPDTMFPVATRPEDIIIVVTGGPGAHSVHVPTRGCASRSQTRVIALKDGTPVRSLDDFLTADKGR